MLRRVPRLDPLTGERIEVAEIEALDVLGEHVDDAARLRIRSRSAPARGERDPSSRRRRDPSRRRSRSRPGRTPSTSFSTRRCANAVKSTRSYCEPFCAMNAGLRVMQRGDRRRVQREERALELVRDALDRVASLPRAVGAQRFAATAARHRVERAVDEERDHRHDRRARRGPRAASCRARAARAKPSARTPLSSRARGVVPTAPGVVPAPAGRRSRRSAARRAGGRHSRERRSRRRPAGARCREAAALRVRHELRERRARARSALPSTARSRVTRRMLASYIGLSDG